VLVPEGVVRNVLGYIITFILLKKLTPLEGPFSLIYPKDIYIYVIGNMLK
jgi:hypothetical protein